MRTHVTRRIRLPRRRDGGLAPRVAAALRALVSVASAWTAVAVAGAACASAGAAGGASSSPSTALAAASDRTAACPAAPAPGGTPATVRVAAAGPLDPADVPVARSPAERLAFRQMYATLVRVDCAGGIRPGVADRWSSSDGALRWTFHLRGSARFWDGTQVTAGDVAWSWRRLAERAGPARWAGGSAGGPWSGELPPALPDSVAVVDAATLVATYREAPSEAAFADPRLAVVRASEGSWALGSGPLRPADAGPAGSGGLRLEPASGSGSTVVVLPLDETRTGDPRDLLDAGLDVVLTSDPRARRYAETLPGYRTLPVPPSRTYALAVPPDAAPGREGARGPADAVPEDALAALRRSLAAEAVREEAEPAGGAWPASACSRGSAPGTTSATVRAGSSPSEGGARGGAAPEAARPRLAYDDDDATARDLADRLVALASSPAGAGNRAGAVKALLRSRPGVGWRTLPLAPGVLLASARAGSEPAYVLALPGRVLDACAARRALARALPWLARGGLLAPLVETRPGVLVREDVTGLGVDFDGTLRLDRAGRKPDPGPLPRPEARRDPGGGP